VSGRARAVYVLGGVFRPLLRDYSNDGYRQAVTPSSDGGVEVRVEVRADAWPVRAPFRFAGLPTWIPEDLRRPLEGRLRRCQRQDEALRSVLLELRNRLRYRERPDFEETPEAVLAAGQGSCVGMTRLSGRLLRDLGIEAREVLGLRLTPGRESHRMEGGILHAWLEIRMDGCGRAFCDPWMSIGWVPEHYLVLRVGGGLQVGALKETLGEIVRAADREDRIFFEPAPETSCILWSRPAIRGFTGTLVTGKVLGEADAPVSGRATIVAGERATSMDLWRGNFFFRDLNPGRYQLRIDTPGGKPQVADLEVHPLDKKRIVLYSR